MVDQIQEGSTLQQVLQDDLWVLATTTEIPFHARRLLFRNPLVLNSQTTADLNGGTPVKVFGGTFTHLDGTTEVFDDFFAWKIIDEHGMIGVWREDGLIVGWLYPEEFQEINHSFYIDEGSVCLH
jgi:hypothetical protein